MSCFQTLSAAVTDIEGAHANVCGYNLVVHTLACLGNVSHACYKRARLH